MNILTDYQQFKNYFNLAPTVKSTYSTVRYTDLTSTTSVKFSPYTKKKMTGTPRRQRGNHFIGRRSRP